MNEDLISRSALLKKVNERYHDPYFDVCLRNAPAVDAVEVVRCKNCEAWKTKTAMSFLRDGVHVRCCSCGVYGRLMYEDDFCSKGKRRADA